MTDRRSLGLWIRIGASVVMLALLVPRVHLRSIAPDWDATTAGWLAAAVGVTACAVAMSALRWQAVLRGLGVRVRLRRLLHHYLAGLFVGNFLPSTIGGDVLRTRRLAAELDDTAVTFASVVLDRLSGMLVLPAITLTALGTNAGLRELGGPSALAAGLSIATLLLLGVVLYLVGHPGIGGRLTGTGRFRQLAGAVHLGTQRFRAHPAAVMELVVAAFVYQLLMVFAALLAARALGIHQVGLTAALAFVPAVNMAQTIPISLGGLGVREGAFVLFLHPLHVSTSQAVGLGLFIYGLNLIVSLLGAPSFVVGGGRRQQVAA